MKESENIFTSSAPRLKTGNLKVVVLCVLAAATFWFFQALNENYSATIDYPINFDFDKSSYIAIQEPPDEIQVNISSVGWNILRRGFMGDVEPLYTFITNPSQIRAIEGQSLRNDVVSQLGEEIELNYIANDSIYLEIDRKASKRCKLVVDSTSIDLRENFFITSEMGISLDSVTLTGPESFLARYSDSLLVRIADTRLDASFNDEVTLETYNNLITVYPESVNVRFKVERFVDINRTIPLQKINFPEDSTYSVVPAIATVSYKVSESNIESVGDDDFSVAVMFDRIVLSDSTIQPLILDYPQVVRNVSITSSRVTVVKTDVRELQQ